MSTTAFVPAATQPVHYRLTRRGRVVLFLVPLALMLAVAGMFGPTVFAADQGASAGAQDTRTVVVQPGQTLWDIAASVSTKGDLRDTVDEIVSLNGLDSASNLQIGTELQVPVTAK